jgi:PAS domain-containing protein
MGCQDKKKAKLSHFRRTQDSQSGYSADLESSASAVSCEKSGKKSPPIWVGLQVKPNKHGLLSGIEDPNKKRRLDEITYDASIAKITLTNAGILCPKFNTHASRISPYIDLSTVRHLHSRPNDDLSHYRLSQNNEWSNGRYDFLTDFGMAYSDMIRQTSFAYQSDLNNNHLHHNSIEDCSDTSSSLSDTESEDSHASLKIVVLNARLDDALETKSNSEMDSFRPITHYMYCPPSVSISMEDAIGFRDSSRLITQALPPYRVVYANAAFESISGIPSSDVTNGSALQDILALQKDFDVFSLESCAAKTVEGETIEVIFQNNKHNPQLSYCMTVTPIMSRKVKSGLHERDSMDTIREFNDVTHFAVDFMPSIHHQQSLDDSRSNRPAQEQSYVTTVA